MNVIWECLRSPHEFISDNFQTHHLAWATRSDTLDENDDHVMSGSCAGHSHSLLREGIQEFGQDYLNSILGLKVTLWSFSQDMIMQDYISVPS